MNQMLTSPLRPKSHQAAALALVAGIALLSACGSKDSGEKDTARSKAEEHTAVAELPPEQLASQAEKEMLSLGGDAGWDGADSSPPPAKGKTVAFMPCNLQITVCRSMEENFKEAAETIGFKANVLDGQGDPTKEQAAVDAALNKGIDCLITMAAPVRDIAPQAATMRQENIPIIEAFGGQDGDVSVGVNQQNAGAALASYVLTHGGGDIIVTGLPQLHEISLRTEGFVDYIERFGEGTAKIVGQEDFTLAELGPGQEAKTRALLAKYPTAEWFVAGADSILYTPLDIAKQEGRKIKGLAFDGEEAAYADLRDGTNAGRGQTATISWALDWVVWSSVDECNRAMQSEPTGVNKDHPIKLTDASNVPPGGSFEPSFDFRAKFKELWGVN